MKIVKITSKYQTTIPQDIRSQLKLKAGDSVYFEIIKDAVVLKKVDAKSRAYLKAVAKSLTEWDSKQDEEAYCDLQNL